MAKHCEVCNKEYPENLSACPHCAAAEGHEPPDSERTGKTTHLAGKPGTPTMLASGGAEPDPAKTAVPRSTKATQLAGHSPSPTMTAKQLEKELSAEDAAAEALLDDEPSKAHAVDSSSVELGSEPVMVLPPSDSGTDGGGSQVQVRAGSSDVDLGVPETGSDASSSHKGHSDSGIPLTLSSAEFDLPGSSGDVDLSGSSGDVDLPGSSGDVDLSAAKPNVPMGVSSDEFYLGESSGDVDLGAMEGGTRSDPGVRVEEEPAEVAEEEPPAEAIAPAKKPAAARPSGMSWLSGGITGAVLGSAASVGVLWFAGLLGSSSTPPASGTGAGSASGMRPQAGTETAADPTRAFFDSGKIDAAVQLARKQQFAEAKKSLAEARAAYQQQRADKPGSEQGEDKVLHWCDELDRYWTTCQRIQAGGQDLSKLNADAAVDSLLGERKNSAEAIAAASKRLEAQTAALKAVADRAGVKSEKPTAEEVQKAIDGLAKSKNEADKQAAAAKDELAKTEKEAADAKKEAADKLATTEKMLADSTAARENLNRTLTDVAKKLENAKLLPPKATGADVVKGVDRAIEVAQIKDPGGQLATLKTELKQSQAQLNQRRSPPEMLDVWLGVLNDGPRKDVAKQVSADLERVANDPEATPELKAKARFVQGLLLRNDGKFAEARTAFEESLKGAGKDEGWRGQARKAHQGLTDPAAYFVPRAEELQGAGQAQAALDVAEEGLKVFPKEERLLALRTQARQELARTPTKSKDADPAEAEQHFANGLYHYNGRRYAQAEQEFVAAARKHNQDARYFYFLGLSRLQQSDKRDDAIEDFRVGAALEGQNKPARIVVSESLERVQGPERQTLNRARP